MKRVGIYAIIILIVLLLSVFLLPRLLNVQAPKVNSPTQAFPTVITKKPQNKLYFISLNDNGKSGKKIGCEDSVVWVYRDIATDEVTGTAVLNELLSYKKRTYEKTELYNALYQSNLVFVDATISGETATVKLRGTIQLGGVCDAPRIEAQLTETVTQFPGIKKADIYINDIPLKDVLSGK